MDNTPNTVKIRASDGFADIIVTSGQNPEHVLNRFVAVYRSKYQIPGDNRG